MARPLVVRDLGRARYDDVLALQLEFVARRIRGEIDDHLLLVEHEPVLTIGRGADRSAVSGLTIPVHEVSRGGEATWHGPGQLVGYPILALLDGERDLHRYLRDLEETMIRACAEFGVTASRHPPHTGAWIGARKVASIGIAVKQWVSYHGFALNVDCDLAAFSGFDPCGLPSAVMTSLSIEAARPIPRAEVAAAIVRSFAAVMDREVRFDDASR